jgi:polyhydroxybutyrate depolymerase
MNRTRLTVLSGAWLLLACQAPAVHVLEHNESQDDVVVGSASQGLLSGCPEAWWMPTDPPVHGEDRSCTFMFQGRLREYFVHIPPTTGQLGVVLEAHSGGGLAIPPATQIVSGWEQVADTEAIAERPSFYVVWPTGRGPATQWSPLFPDWWTCEYKQPGCPPVAGEANERDFLVAVVNDLKTRTTTVDAKRVYAVGLSSGAAMTHMLACDHSDKFAAVAAIAGGVFALTQEPVYNYDLRPLCNPVRKVPHFYAHAVQDAVVPFSEGEASVAFWRSKLGCSAIPASTNSFESPADNDGLNDPSVCQRFNCQSSSKLEFCTLDASRNLDWFGGHAAWFGDDLEQPSIQPEVSGTPHRLARLAWEFMSQFTLP